MVTFKLWLRLDLGLVRVNARVVLVEQTWAENAVLPRLLFLALVKG